jgi:hypothetical protein
VRESQAPPAQQPAAPAPTATGRLDVRRIRGFTDQPVTPALTQKAPARRDTNAADELRSVTAAEERDAAGAGSVAAPAPAPAANAATRNPEVRLQAVTVEAAPAPLDSAAVRAILGREPLVIPGLPVLGVRRSPRTPREIVVEQVLDATQVILLFESRQVVVQRSLQSDRAVPAAVAKAVPDSLPGRFMGGLLVEIQARITTDSVLKLLGKIKP